MVNSIQAEIYKLTRRPYFYVFNLLCALFALLVVGCLAYVKYTAPSNQDAISFPFPEHPAHGHARRPVPGGSGRRRGIL